jgi:hypothetical protein
MWNYRVVRKKNTYIDPANKKERVDYTYAIHEAYYDENVDLRDIHKKVNNYLLSMEKLAVHQFKNGVKSMVDPCS